MELPLLEQVLVLLAASLPVSMLLRRLGQSTIVGFLLTGLIIGPGCLGVITGDEIHGLAELGVGLLLFSVGMEFSLSQLARTVRLALVGGGLQVTLCACLFGAVAFVVTGRGLEAAYLGCAVALSSSAIILKTLAEKSELDSPHAAGTVAIAIVQDLSTVPMLVVLPVLGAGAASGAGLIVPVLEAFGKALALLVGLWAASRFLVGPLLFRIARLRSPEIFLVAVVVLVLAAGFGAERVGLSLALGAFCAGLLLSDSDFSHQIRADVHPFESVFQAIFFVSVGLLLDPRWALAHAGVVLLAVPAVVLGKAALTFAAARAGGAAGPVAGAIGVTLVPLSEFAFVLLEPGHRSGAISDEAYQLVLSVAVASMALGPLLVGSARPIVGALARLPLLRKALRAGPEAALGAKAHALSGHIVIAGFGPVGRDVAQFLLDAGKEFVALETNPKTVRELRASGVSIFYGDASSEIVLAEAGVKRASALVVAIPDSLSARRAVEIGRALNPRLHIVARAKYRSDAARFLKVGATEVVEEEFETAREMVVRMARTLGLSEARAAEAMEGQRPEHLADEAPATPAQETPPAS